MKPNMRGARNEIPAELVADPVVEGWSAGYGLVLLAVAGLIVYGSLFPFHFARPISGRAVLHLLHSWTVWDRPGDLTANILLYLPLGFCAVQTLPPRIGVVPRILLAALLGAGMATCVELIQFHEPARFSSMGDVYANALGAALGGGIAAATGRRISWPLLPEIRARPDAALLVVLFLADRLYPYVPTESLVKYQQTLSGLLARPHVAPGAMLQLAICWLLIAAAIEAMYGRRRWYVLFPLLAVLELGSHILVLRAALQWTDVAAAALGAVLWLALPQAGRSRSALPAALFAGLFVGLQLRHPVFASAPPPGLAWLPFAGLPWSAPHLLVPALCGLAFLCGGLIWALIRCGAPIWTAIAATCALLIATGLVQVVRVGQAFSLTGIVVALAIGGVFALLRCAAKPPPAFSPTHPRQ